MKKLTIYLVLVIAILVFSFNHVSAIGTPTAVCPGVPFGQTGPYHSSRNPTFMWTAVEGATWYQIYLSYTDDTGTALLKQWVRGINSWTFSADFDLYPGEDYSWWVRSYDGSYSSWSNRADFTVGHLKVISINPSAFVPEIPGNLGSYQFGSELKPFQDFTIPGSSTNVWLANLTLPDLSLIEYLRLYYKNHGSASSATVCSIYRSYIQNDLLPVESWITTDTTTEDGIYDTTTYFTHSKRRVNNSSSSYGVKVMLPTVYNHFVRVEIGYWD